MAVVDKYHVGKVLEMYYEYISYGGVLIYLYFARRKDAGEWVEIPVSELRESVGLTPECMRKYELLCCVMGLLEVERIYYPNDTDQEAIPMKKKYRLRQPMEPAVFKQYLKQLNIPNLNRIKHLDPEKNEKQFKALQQKLSMFFNGDDPVNQKNDIQTEQFKKRDGVDLFFIDRLFGVYGFLPEKAKVFYIYMYKEWLKRSCPHQFHIPRKSLKKTLGYGDEQVRKSMYLLAAIGLMEIKKGRYYLFKINKPLAIDELKTKIEKRLLPIESDRLSFMTPNNRLFNEDNVYYQGYMQLKNFVQNSLSFDNKKEY